MLQSDTTNIHSLAGQLNSKKLIKRQRFKRYLDILRSLTDLVPYFALIWSSGATLMVASLAMRLVRALLPMAILLVAKLIVDGVVVAMHAPIQPSQLQDWLSNPQLLRLLLLLLAEFTLAVSADALGRAVSLIDGLLSERLSKTASVKLMRHAAALDLAQLEDAGFQDQLDRARHQTSSSMTLMTQVFNQLQDLVTVTSFTIGLLIYAPWVTVLLVLSLLPAFMGEAHFNTAGYALDFLATHDKREVDYLRQTTSNIETAKEIKIFDLSGMLIARYRQLTKLIYNAHRNLGLRRAGWGTVFSFIGTAGNYFAYGSIVWGTVSGHYSVGELTFLVASFQRLRGLLEGLLAGLSSIGGQALYLKDLFSFFDIKPTILSPSKPRLFPTPMRSGITFENVGFKYPGAKLWTIRNLNLKLEVGETVALVGENGAGKTTLVKLLARLYDPSEGRILLDGYDLREYDIADLRRSLGIIFQDFVRYNFTVSDNVAVGDMSARHDEFRIRRAATRARADGVINKLANGYQQMIGKRFRDGVDLSGGEWQKIAIARAYMRQAEMLILDEPTAALDARSEFEVFQKFKDLSKGKTTLFISHRFSSVRMADRVLVFADGKLEAQGTHEELLAERGRYAELFELQAAGYR
jgi:ATP-binding cassette, subfamily B, bacterial